MECFAIYLKAINPQKQDIRVHGLYNCLMVMTENTLKYETKTNGYSLAVTRIDELVEIFNDYQPWR